MSKIPEYILCKNPEEARRVLEKIERESDYLWLSLSKPTKHDVSKYDVPIVLHFDCKIITVSTERNFREYLGITNFTKAEDFLLSDETKIRLQELDNKLDKLINSMTNKTWNNLADKDTLLAPDGDEREVLGVCGRMVFITLKGHDDSDSCEWTKQELINAGYKIKGASEEKLSIGDAIEWINNLTGIDKQIKNQAIEMLKKLK